MNVKKKALIEITLMYLIIALSGVFSYKFIQTDNIILDFLVADLVMTLVTFIFSIGKKNSSVYDAYWSVIPFYFVAVFVVELYQYLEFYHYLVFFVISLWSWRLTLSWARGWPGFHHEDFRYVDLAKKTGTFYPVVNFLGIHLFPTLVVFACFWPAFYVIQAPDQEWLLYLGVVIGLLGVYFEYAADNELARFRKRSNPKLEDLLDTGIWGRSRNPNYLGEMLFWLGVLLCGLACGAPWYTATGFLCVALMFFFISIPMKDKRMSERRAGWEDYKKRVPLIIPRIF